VPLNVNRAWNYFWTRGQRRTAVDDDVDGATEEITPPRAMTSVR